MGLWGHWVNHSRPSSCMDNEGFLLNMNVGDLVIYDGSVCKIITKFTSQDGQVCFQIITLDKPELVCLVYPYELKKKTG